MPGATGWLEGWRVVDARADSRARVHSRCERRKTFVDFEQSWIGAIAQRNEGWLLPCAPGFGDLPERDYSRDGRRGDKRPLQELHGRAGRVRAYERLRNSSRHYEHT